MNTKHNVAGILSLSVLLLLPAFAAAGQRKATKKTVVPRLNTTTSNFRPFVKPEASGSAANQTDAGAVLSNAGAQSFGGAGISQGIGIPQGTWASPGGGAAGGGGGSGTISGDSAGSAPLAPGSGEYVCSAAGGLRGTYSSVDEIVADARSVNFDHAITVDGRQVYPGFGPALSCASAGGGTSGGTGSSGADGGTAESGAVIVIDASDIRFSGLSVKNPKEVFPESHGDIILAYKVVYGTPGQVGWSDRGSFGVYYNDVGVLEMSVSGTPGFFPPDLQGGAYTGTYCAVNGRANDLQYFRTMTRAQVRDSESQSKIPAVRSAEGCKLTIGKTYYINLRVAKSALAATPGHVFKGTFWLVR